MTTPIRTLLLAVVLLFGSSQVGYAQDFDKGDEAYFRGDYAAALKEWRPLAFRGNASAQYLLGGMYRNGYGVTQDNREAVKWYRLAAEQGLAYAQASLGIMYGNGEGVIQDKVYAHMWYNIAASDGNEPAKERRDIVTKELTPSQLEEATRLARECVKKEYKGC